MPLVISAQSLEYVRMPIHAEEAGLAVDPTSATVQIAFPALGVAASSWLTASWETDATRDPDVYYARALVGPGAGVITLTAGSKYDMWAKITGLSPEAPIIKATDFLLVTA